MDRLALAVVFNLLVNWILLGLAFRHIQNLWFSDLLVLPRMVLALWVFSSLSPRPLSAFFLAPALLITLGCAVWDAASLGLSQKWLTTITISNLVLFALCLWTLKDLFLQADGAAASHQPAFWMLGSWAMAHGITLFYTPLFGLFLKHLSPAWIVVPGLAYFLVGLILNITLSWTFLCRKSLSS